MARQYRREVYRSARIVVEFEMDRRGIAQVAKGPELRHAVKDVAEKGKTFAQSIAPAGTGHYRDSFAVAVSRVVVRGMRRVAARLVNLDEAATAIEVGSETRPAHRTLQQTLVYLGSRPEVRGELGVPGVPRAGEAGELRPIPALDELRQQQERKRRRQRRRR